ncbi:MAG: flagellar hook-associated protein FlgK [Desulfovibrio sp.]|jgi:flagellar hook-associated protein 1 FlgK|nr:flagellar hook-associated protein FlgK [Desulfovibrio sp.]
MAWGVNSVMNVGVGALFASQAAIQTTGNNVANVNTPGYSRRYVVLEERNGLDFYPGRVGEGVLAKEVRRYFDKFIESNYLNKLGTSSRYTAEYDQLRYVENLFNEANVNGTASALSEFFNAWNKLAQSPAEGTAREALLGKAAVLMDDINNTDRALRDLEEQTNTMIREDVAKANLLLREIAELNKQINAHYLEGRNNPNDLMDARDAKVRALGAIIDVKVDDKGPGHYNVSMANGYTLVQDTIPFSLEFKGMQAENNLTTNSPFRTRQADGSQRNIYFNGSDNFEYTIEMVERYWNSETGQMETAGKTIHNPPDPTNPPADPGPARFRVSIDGGKTWLTDEAGHEVTFNAQTEENAVRVGELEIYFDSCNDIGGDSIAYGDRFLIWPKPDVYWIEPTSDPINISTQIYKDGSDNSLRLTGGSLAGYLEFRDYQLAEYRDRLDAFAKSTIWEVNRIHSQGGGLEPMTYALGTYVVGNTAQPMGSPEARFVWADKLQSGNLTFAIYDANGNQMLPGSSPYSADTVPPFYPGFDVLGQAGGNFDPSIHSLQDLVAGINDPANPISEFITASIVNNKLQVTGKPIPGEPGKVYSFAVSADTTGLAAALGINTFFEGTNADTFAIRGELFTNTNLINAGRLNGAGEINPGDNITALEIENLAIKQVSIGTFWNRPTTQSIAAYYGGIVTKIGTDTMSTKFVAASETAMATDLYNRQEEISGVNLDEEMSNLIKFQASYKAAAKLITTADEMLQTLLSMK